MTMLRPRIAGVLLAAGASSRLGRPKQLVEIDGETMIRRSARVLVETVHDVAVVLGAYGDTIARTLSGLPATHLYNADWSSGMASSVRLGVAWARELACDAILLSVCDQPNLDAAHLARVVASYRGTAIGSRYLGTIGVPALFPRSMFDQLTGLTGDRGAQALLVSADSVSWETGAIDIDIDTDMTFQGG